MERKYNISDLGILKFLFISAEISIEKAFSLRSNGILE